MRVRLFYLIALTLAATVSGQSSAQAASAADGGGRILDSAQLAHASGAVIYRHICQACHMADAEGAVGAGRIFALARDARLASAEYMAAIVLNGRGDMPAFRPRPDYTGLEALDHVTLSDAQITAVINYVRTHFGNHYRDRMTAAEVGAVRLRTVARHPDLTAATGGPALSSSASGAAAIHAAEAWAFPAWPSADPGVAKPDLHKVLHVAGSTRSYTLGEIGAFDPPDWFPQDHPPMPRIVAQGRKPAWPCATCHLSNGVGGPASAALTGLPKAYILEQFAAFRHQQRGASAPRTAQDMAHEARSVDDADLQQAAGYFSSLRFKRQTRVVETATVPKTHWNDFVLVPDSNAAREPLGARIIVTPADTGDYEAGDPRTEYVAYVPPGSIERGALIAAQGVGAALPCESCHGATLQGVGNVPPLAGRSPAYIARELILFRTGERTNPGAAPMRLEASRLSVGDVIAVAAYAASREP